MALVKASKNLNPHLPLILLNRLLGACGVAQALGVQNGAAWAGGWLTGGLAAMSTRASKVLAGHGRPWRLGRGPSGGCAAGLAQI